jgi:hypothetical protein
MNDHVTDLANHFRRDFGVRLTLRRVPRLRNFGSANRGKDGRFVIKLRKDLCEGGQIAFLIHEMSHVVSWESDTHPSDHGPMFGLAYSDVWQSYLRWAGHAGPVRKSR